MEDMEENKLFPIPNLKAERRLSDLQKSEAITTGLTTAFTAKTTSQEIRLQLPPSRNSKCEDLDKGNSIKPAHYQNLLYGRGG